MSFVGRGSCVVVVRLDGGCVGGGGGAGESGLVQADADRAVGDPGQLGETLGGHASFVVVREERVQLPLRVAVRRVDGRASSDAASERREVRYPGLVVRGNVDAQRTHAHPGARKRRGGGG